MNTTSIDIAEPRHGTKTTTSAGGHPSITIHCGRTFQDPQTGRTIRQLTDFPEGAHLGYFRNFRQLPDGRMLGMASHDDGNAILIDPESGGVELLPHRLRSLKLREHDGRLWFLGPPPSDRGRSGARPAAGKRRQRHAAELWHIDLPHGKPVLETRLPLDMPGYPADITIDGQNLIYMELEQDLESAPIPTTKDVNAVNLYFNRRRRGALHVYHIATGTHRTILETQAMCPSHIDTSPADPGLVRYCLDMPETRGQRIWTIRIDGSENRPIRPTVSGEMITHEFWWSDPRYIGFTYQDRREDPTVDTELWAEYAHAHTRLGIADLEGREVYMSDPLNSYHTHIYRSSDGRLVCGEGTESNSFVCAATFSMQTTRIDMVPLATIHATYTPFRGQNVDCNFSADGRWLIYADQPAPGKPHQIFAVAVDL